MNTLEELNGHKLHHDPLLRSRMEKRMEQTFVVPQIPWTAGHCRVCGEPLQTQKSVRMEAFGQVIDLDITVCDDCDPIVAEHYQGVKDKSPHPRFDQNCPNLYRKLIYGDLDLGNADRVKIQKVSQWKYGDKGLILSGDSGAGKTTALWSLYREMDREGIAVDYWPATELGRELSKCARDITGSYHLTRKKLLMIDDFGKERITAAACSLWYELLHRRYEQMLPIIISTRFTGEDFVKRMGGDDNRTTAKDIHRRLSDTCYHLQFRKQ